MPSPVEDVTKFDRVTGEADDYRHRQLTNIAVLLVCLLLTFAGIWIVNKIADLRRDQDCALSGRRNCAQLPSIGAPAR
jgi:hypothetical protein